MKGQLSVALRRRNPDVLTCIANLSNDEVFTPPEFANRMLDTLAEAWAVDNNGADLWANSSLRFLDPSTKSGVLLREIASRLTKGLAPEFPDLEKRVDHILTKQVFGIGITQLTSLLARRSLYCSKHANGQHSVAQVVCRVTMATFGSDRTEHTWMLDGKCEYCGASSRTLDRGAGLRKPMQLLIHSTQKTTSMRSWQRCLEATCSLTSSLRNPPYQLDDGGYGTSAAPIYNKFVEQAKKLNPRLLTMVIPARWFAGGKGLDEFRESMLTDNRLRSIDDYLSASDVFPGVGLKGGVCYFLWDRDNPSDLAVSHHTSQGGASLDSHPPAPRKRRGRVHPLQ